jgi:heme/copper-type cytochrome/quinol oxidase subunit 2
VKEYMVKYSTLVLIFALVAALTILGVDSASFAQEGGAGTGTQQYIIARVEIWALFYRLMVVAFVIGAVVMGTITYVVWRFRESHPKNRGSITPASGGARH